eukprot:TRINITY_DN13075_c0_g1_i2.p1 TRINITY_DN13075_c0_g1~~TRINITY_DN13075_c0_g1_i2.p1  ORF type:complete len:394 (-),score=65.14 TRINITY_DN13075_c0_g1_i2:398-1579(-)
MSDADIRYHISEFCAAEAAEDWQSVQDDSLPDGVSIRHRSCGPRRIWICMTFETPVPLDFIRSLTPEVLSEYPILAKLTVDFELVEHLAPGDCLVKLVSTPATQVLTDILIGQGTGPHNMRFTHCEDVPRPGEGTCVFVGLGENWLDFSHASKTAWFGTHRQGKTADSTSYSCTFKSSWEAYPPFITQVAKMMAAYTEPEAEVMLKEMPRLRDIAAGFYTVVTLRGCCRGPPLLPHLERSQTTTEKEIGGYYWEAPQKGGCLPFSTVLLHLLKTCGSNAQVFTSMYGQRLVPYQVAVLTSSWMDVEAPLQQLWTAQCSAYRFVRGGSGAPKLAADLKARIASENIPMSEPTRLSIDDFMIFKMENKTFVDFQVAQDNFVDRHLSLPRKAHEYP